jgi:hypothetical protein
VGVKEVRAGAGVDFAMRGMRCFAGIENKKIKGLHTRSKGHYLFNIDCA